MVYDGYVKITDKPITLLYIIYYNILFYMMSNYVIFFVYCSMYICIWLWNRKGEYSCYISRVLIPFSIDYTYVYHGPYSALRGGKSNISFRRTLVHGSCCRMSPISHAHQRQRHGHGRHTSGDSRHVARPFVNSCNAHN